MKKLILGVALTSALFAMQNTQPQFGEYDTNKDGSISEVEFDALKANRMTKNAEAGKQMLNAGNSAAFSDVDKNKDGKIDPEELKIAQQQQLQKNNSQPNGNGGNGGRNYQNRGNNGPQNAMQNTQPQFGEYDTNKDGSVSEVEFDALKANRMTKNAEAGKQMLNAGNSAAFSDVDKNKDGKIDPEELKIAQQQQLQKNKR